ncbi:hypothetical protein [Curtobacterium sp. MCBA15_005]|uniref:hypothetical protein n=1 Tax=Curtobacterium sp. MCBA15_005 TaxID=1898734 RepID=UPI0008DE7D50|nr:hypothetical protein [Curtobacterium sp. MCBA15_005]OII02701.1 hypothetical protein BIU89_02310 [Curtobacterium sp. MCBA15_005]
MNADGVLWMITGIAAVSAGFTVVGGLAYLGLWRTWVHQRAWSADRVFPTLFLGVGGMLLATFAALLETGLFVVTAVAIVLAFVLIVTSVFLFVLGVPRWMTPRWYRDVLDQR